MAHVSDVHGMGIALPANISNLRADLSTRFAQFRTYRRTLTELNHLSQRELDDLGLSRFALRDIAYKATYGTT